MLKRSRVSASPASSVLNDACVAFLSLAFIGSFFYLPPALVIYYRKKCRTRKRKIIFWSILLGIITFPVPVVRGVSQLRIWDSFGRYFSLSAVGRIGAVGNQQAMYAIIPHGVFPMSLALAACGRFNRDYFGSLRVVGVKYLLHVPLIGHLLKLIGLVDAKATSINRALEQGLSLGINPGGIGEMFVPQSMPGRDFALIMRRKRFIELAMDHGVPVVPVYCFGATQMFKVVPFFKRQLEYISRYLKMSILLFFGRFGLPIPYKVHLQYAFGSPIDTTWSTSMDAWLGETRAERVERFHSSFCQSLLDIFNDHSKSYYGEDTTAPSLEFL